MRLVLCSSLSLPVFSPTAAFSPTETGIGQRGAELGIEGLEVHKVPVSVGILGWCSCASLCCPAAILYRMLGTLGLWTLLPAVAQGKCLQVQAGSLHHPVRGKVYLKPQLPTWMKKRSVGE